MKTLIDIVVLVLPFACIAFGVWSGSRKRSTKDIIAENEKEIRERNDEWSAKDVRGHYEASSRLDNQRYLKTEL